MSEPIRVRLYAQCELRIPVYTEIDRDEFVEWYEESGAVFSPDDIDADAVVEFINASPDSEYETVAQFPPVDPLKHDILAFTINEAEVLGQEAGDE